MTRPIMLAALAVTAISGSAALAAEDGKSVNFQQPGFVDQDLMNAMGYINHKLAGGDLKTSMVVASLGKAGAKCSDIKGGAHCVFNDEVRRDEYPKAVQWMFDVMAKPDGTVSKIIVSQDK